MALTSLNLIPKREFAKELTKFLKMYENELLTKQTKPTKAGGIHDDGKGIPTVGYGLNLKDLSATIIEKSFKLALTGSTDGKLTPVQTAGINIIKAWKNPNDGIAITDQSLIGISQGTSGTNAQRQALQSLWLTDKQAEVLLTAYINGYSDLFRPLEENINKYLAVSKIPLPQESQERLALFSLFYNLPKLVGPDIQSAIATDNHAKFWYEIRYNHKNFADVGLQNRREAESNLVGILSPSQIKDPEAALKAADTLFDRSGGNKSIYNMILTRDTIINKTDPTNIKIESFAVKIQPILETLSKKYADGSKIDFVQFGDDKETVYKPGAALYSGKTVDQTNDLVIAGNNKNKIETGGGDDWIYSGKSEDNILAGAGTDSIFSGAGNDMIDGGRGADIMHGDKGFDTYVIDDPGDIIYDDDGGEIMTSINITESLEHISAYTNLKSNLSHKFILPFDKVIAKNYEIAAYVFKGTSGNDRYEFILPDEKVFAYIDTGSGNDTIKITNSGYQGINNNPGLSITDFSTMDRIDITDFQAETLSNYDSNKQVQKSSYYYDLASGTGFSTLTVWFAEEGSTGKLEGVVYASSPNTIYENQIIL